MTNRKLSLVSMLVMLPMFLLAQAEALFNNTLLNDSLEEVTQKTSEISATQNVFTNTIPRFPLAKERESHLLCTNLKTNNGTIDKVVFTFADDKLVYIEAKGNVQALTSKRQDTARTYLDYDVYLKDKLFVKSVSDQAWIINDEAMHVNLFTWENPYLKSDFKSNALPINKAIPEFIKMGASLSEMQPVLETNSQFSNKEVLDGKDPNAQLQINAFGVNYLGFPRKVEARFGDEKLNVVWILTAKGEEDRIRQALIEQYGKPIFVDDNWEIFNDWQVGLRKDKPEILLIEKALGQVYKKQFFKQE